MQTICIIIPCFNEEKRFPQTTFEEYIGKNNIHFCLVNDGSKDNTLSVLQNIKNNYPNRVSVVNKQKNEGKAEAVRTGLNEMAATGKFTHLGFFDADLATPLCEIDHLLKNLEGNAQFVFGSRIKRLGSSVNRSTKRHYIGRFFATLASMILKLGVYDTQCGAKIMSTQLAQIVSKEKFNSKWLFDIEIFARMTKHFGREKVLEVTVEVPLNTWHEMGDSRIKMNDMLKVPFELYKIHRIYNR